MPRAVPRPDTVLLACGTRGDVQPFVALALRMRDVGHRVRLATHAVFRTLAAGRGLEFYPLGGDPEVSSRQPAGGACP